MIAAGKHQTGAMGVPGRRWLPGGLPGWSGASSGPGWGDAVGEDRRIEAEGGWPVRGVFGLETEYGIAGAPLGAEAAARELFGPVVAWGRATNVFTPAGARLYLDVGSHPEYATAECASLTELVCQDLAGDAIMAELARAARARGDRAAQRLVLFKNNADAAGNGFGSHENYQVPREGSAALAAGLIPFLVTRQLIGGAGQVQVSPAGARYVLSGRADHVWEALSSATTRARPMINTRDEPLADGSRYRRLHVIVGDSNMSQSQVRWKVGATALVIAAAQEARLPVFELADPVRAIRTVSHGWREARPVHLAGGLSIKPAAIQRAFLDFARPAATTAQDAAVIDLWERALDAWDQACFDGLETELDWLAKLRLIERYQARTGAGLADPRVARLELSYHQIGSGGLRGRLEAAGLLARVVDAADAARAVLTPPATRADLRGRFIQAARGAGRDYTVDWVRLKLGDGPAIALPDPLDNADPVAQHLVAELAGTASSNAVGEFDRILERAAANLRGET
ncbi:MAG: proteasome accessory factor PafA2 family protein [Bifidobacteriaceae bacterium]|jgi:proteasome accessory factor A|nr:proteasome accessory factor PafA2 family protein [Bifidobacteriaceae bacterium]